MVDTQAPRPGLLVVAEAYYPGWTATVNGSPASCLPVNGWMRGVPIPAGASEVAFHFHSTFLVPGALLSSCTLVLLVAVLLAGGRRRRAQSQGSDG